MPIVDFDTPRTGRTPRLSDNELEMLAQKVRAGGWASDGVATDTRSAAYQRAQTAVKLLGKRHGLVNLKTHSCPVDPAITALETEMVKLLVQAKTTLGTELAELKQQCAELAQRIAALGGYHWAVGPRPDGESPPQRRVG